MNWTLSSMIENDICDMMEDDYICDMMEDDYIYDNNVLKYYS